LFSTQSPQMRNLQMKMIPIAPGNPGTTQKKICIIGGGIAGVACAWNLMNDPQKRFDITLYEADDYLGGAVRSKVYKSPEGKEVIVDTAVVFTEENFYPNLYQLVTKLGVETEQVELGSTGTFKSASGHEEVWSNVWKGLDLRKKFADESNRFMIALAELQGEQDPRVLFTMTAGDWVKKHGFSDEFIQKAVIPMLLTFAITRNGLLSVPLAVLHIYFGGGALQFVTGNYGRRAKNGWKEYMDKMAKTLGDTVKLQHKVTAITRKQDGKGVDVTVENGGTTTTNTFDEVVVCILKDQALQLLGDSASPAEKQIFSSIEYEDMIVYGHNDPNVLSPKLKDDQGYWHYQYFNYRYDGNDFGNYVRGATTYVPLHDPDNLTKEVQLPLLTYANAEKFEGVVLPREDLIIDQKKWRHVKQSVPMFGANLELNKVNGKDRIWYAGNDTVINFHEGALCSGLVISKALGVDYPFKGQFKAEWVFNLFDQFMMKGLPPYELTQLQPH